MSTRHALAIGAVLTLAACSGTSSPGPSTPAGQTPATPTASPAQITAPSPSATPTSPLPLTTPTPLPVVTPTPVPTVGLAYYPLADANGAPAEIAVGPDKNIWFADQAGKIGFVTASGAITEFSVPTSPPSAPVAGPTFGISSSINIVGGLAAGPDGRTWFTESAKSQVVGAITTSGQITEYAWQGSGSIVFGSDGRLWSSCQTPLGRSIGATTIATGAFTCYQLPQNDWGGQLLAAGPDGNIWYAGSGANFAGPGTDIEVGKVTPAGVYTEYSTTWSWMGTGLHGQLSSFIQGPDGNMWFGGTPVGPIGKITPAGAFTFYDHSVSSMASAKGKIWFVSFYDHVPFASRTLSSITTSGIISTSVVPLPPLVDYLGLRGLAQGPDQNLWSAVDGDKSGARFSAIGKMPI